MSNTTNNQKDIIKKLDEVVSNSKDAVDFYNSAQTKAEDPDLKKIFAQLANTHRNTLIAVERLIQVRGKDRSAEDISGTIIGQSNKLFGELLASISSKPDEKLIARLEEAEDRCLHSLEEATNIKEFSATERQLLESELLAVKNSHGNMKYLKQTYAA